MSHTLRLIHDGSIQIKSAATYAILCKQWRHFFDRDDENPHR